VVDGCLAEGSCRSAHVREIGRTDALALAAVVRPNHRERSLGRRDRVGMFGRKPPADALFDVGAGEEVLQLERRAAEALRAQGLALEVGCVVEVEAADRCGTDRERDREGNEHIGEPLLVRSEPRSPLRRQHRRTP
jgi:hypothetical protein